MTGKKRLWVCPNCGRQFVSVNRNHSCGVYSLEEHFTGKEPIVRELYNLLFETLKQFGPVRAFPLRSRIVFQAEVQFAAAVPRKRWLEGYLWLQRQAVHPRIHKLEMGVFRDYVIYSGSATSTIWMKSWSVCSMRLFYWDAKFSKDIYKEYGYWNLIPKRTQNRWGQI